LSKGEGIDLIDLINAWHIIFEESKDNARETNIGTA